ncbi:MAG: glutamine-hydrolyzing GMP synthase [Bacillota bacterium]|nr:glutamine-hydrolyzing GMP synthase [Bacillota bacterium]
MDTKEFVLILDFGGQYNQLIARRVREENVYCEVHPYTTPFEKIKEMSPSAVIFTGGPNSVYDEGSPKCDVRIFEMGVPVLGICYGAQLMAYMLGGKVENAANREYGKIEIDYKDSPFYKDVTKHNICWMSHNDYISKLPEGFTVTGTTNNCPSASFENAGKALYGIQFHLEVNHTNEGSKMIHNFLYEICKFKGNWNMANFVESQINYLKEKIGDRKALCALSGGVDSSVCAVLMHKAIGKNLTCIFVDHGLLRKGEAESVEKMFTEQYDINFVKVDVKDQFLSKLKGVTEPEKKRKIIGEEFIRVFEKEAKKIGTVDYLVQGTIYPDVIESGLGDAAVIKSHHNVGGLPDHVDFKEIIEPLRLLFKDEVRRAGIELGMPEDMVWRQPFPGPGLGIRVIGEVTEDKLDILRDADAIFREEIKNAALDRSINQYFAVITDMKSVGVMGDMRTYEYTIALRAVTTTDFMTADWAKIPYEVLDKVANRIINEVAHVNRICYDITSKPPATIEWE